MQLKFYKNAVADILSGKKTLEPRPRSPAWIRRIKDTKVIDLTYGPRFGPPRVFAKAKIVKVETRPFETATKEDLRCIALGWEKRTVKEFVGEYNKWFADQLSKGYQVAWVYFKVPEPVFGV